MTIVSTSGEGRVDLRRLRYFVAVADALHFGRAAAALNMSIPPLSQRIRELEDALGVQLFERTSRRVELTRAGAALLPGARETVEAAARFVAAASALAGAHVTTFGLGHAHGSEDVVVRALKSLRTEHPELTVWTDALTTARIIDGVRRGRLAVGVVRGEYPSTVSGRRLANVPIDHVAVPRDHPLARRRIVGVDDLDGAPVLLANRAEAPTIHDELLGYCESHGAEPRWIMHGATQIERVLDMVAAGTGIGWLNTWQAARVRSGRRDVAVKPLTPPVAVVDYNVIWSGDGSEAVGTMVSALQNAVD